MTSRRGLLKLIGLAPLAPIAAAIPAAPVMAWGISGAKLKISGVGDFAHGIYDFDPIERELHGLPEVQFTDKVMDKLRIEFTPDAASIEAAEQPYWGA